MISQGGACSDDGKKLFHQPVLLEETISAIRPRPGGTYGDLTLGGGGHALELLDRSSPDGFLLGLDRDGEVLDATRKRLGAFAQRISMRQGNFSRAAEIFDSFIEKVDGVVMDLGLSSFQLDRRDRGFSIYRDGPLDLRMDTSQDFTGQEFVNKGSEEDLLHAVGTLGEERKAKAVVKAILAERRKRPLLHTSDIRSLVEQVFGRKGGRIHPATRTFQGLRMWVNQELESLHGGLEAAFNLLKRGGRLAVISFHSGEDRVVKLFFRDGGNRGEAEILSRKPIRPSASEVRRNRRSRSACLRVLEKR